MEELPEDVDFIKLSQSEYTVNESVEPRDDISYQSVVSHSEVGPDLLWFNKWLWSVGNFLC